MKTKTNKKNIFVPKMLKIIIYYLQMRYSTGRIKNYSLGNFENMKIEFLRYCNNWGAHINRSGWKTWYVVFPAMQVDRIWSKYECRKNAVSINWLIIFHLMSNNKTIDMLFFYMLQLNEFNFYATKISTDYFIIPPVLLCTNK